MKWEKFISSGIRMPFYMRMFLEGVRDEMPRLTGFKSEHWLVNIDQQLTSVYYDPKTDSMMIDFLRQKIRSFKFITQLPEILRSADDNALKFSRLLYYSDYSKIDQRTLVKLLQRFEKLFRIKFGLYALPKLLSDAVIFLLPQLIKARISKEDLSVLITADFYSDFNSERIALLQIVEIITKRDLSSLFDKTDQEIIDQLGRFYPDLYYQIECYTREFNWVPVNHHVQPLNMDLALTAIRVALSEEDNLSELAELLKKPKVIKLAQQKLNKKYNFSEVEFGIIQFLKEINIINESRKVAMSKILLWSYPLFQAIADFLKVDVVSLRQLSCSEIYKLIKQGKIGPSHISLMRERLCYYFLLLEDGKISEESGDKAKKIINKLLTPLDNQIKELKGTIAYKGKVTGKVRLILIEYQAQNLKEGEILVSSMTDPDMVPAMKKAGAIVTDEGGITCHAAIVARELGKPCIIGTKIATKILKDGDLVEVDANNGIVKKLN